MSEEAMYNYRNEHIPQAERDRSTASKVGLNRNDIALAAGAQSEREVGLRRTSYKVGGEVMQLVDAGLSQEVVMQYMMERLTEMERNGELAQKS